MRNHQHFLDIALTEARLRRGFCAPNPAVGAVIVKNGEILSKSHHFGAGFPHAEIQALESVGDRAEGATLYVTLEPCCHMGKTPPCVNAIKSSKIAKVYYAFTDPNPKVQGQGALWLNQNGIPCEQIQHDAVNLFYQSYQYWWQHKKPFVTAKIAMSLDAAIATADKNPVKLTSDLANTFTHQSRYQSDALLTTAETILRDNPKLDARLHEGTFAKPIYILDRELRVKPHAEIFKTAQSIVIFHSPTHTPNAQENIRYIAIPDMKNQLIFSPVLEVIGADGIHDVWVEAGGILFESLLKEKLVQRACLLIAGKTLGHQAYKVFSNTEENLFANAKSIRWTSLGRDALCEIDLED